MEITENNLIIDWELAIKLAGNKKDLAEELLTLLLKNLSTDIAEMKVFSEKKDYKKLKELTHKLHGALCYCGVPRLKQAVANLENALKENSINNIHNLFNQVEMEAHLLIQLYNKTM